MKEILRRLAYRREYWRGENYGLAYMFLEPMAEQNSNKIFLDLGSVLNTLLFTANVSYKNLKSVLVRRLITAL